MTSTVSAGTGLRPLGVAELLDNAVRLVRRNPAAAFGLTVPFALVSTVVVAVVQVATYNTDSAAVAQLVVALAVTGVLGPILTGLLTPVFVGDVLGRRMSLGEAAARARKPLAPLLVLGLVVIVPQLAGLFLFVIGGLWLWGIWAVAAPALVTEGQTVRGALGRSFHLTRTAFWRAWGVRALGWVVTTVLSFFVTLPFLLLASNLLDYNPFDATGNSLHRPGLYVTIVAVGRVLGVLLTAPVSAAVDTMLYLDLRMRREGMDLVLGLRDVPPAADVADHAPAPVTAW